MANTSADLALGDITSQLNPNDRGVRTPRSLEDAQQMQSDEDILRYGGKGSGRKFLYGFTSALVGENNAKKMVKKFGDKDQQQKAFDNLYGGEEKKPAKKDKLERIPKSELKSVLEEIKDSLKDISELRELVEQIHKRIFPRDINVGKGTQAQTYRFDPLAPEGKQVTEVNESGLAGSFAGKKETAAVLSKAAYLGNQDLLSTLKNKPEDTETKEPSGKKKVERKNNKKQTVEKISPVEAKEIIKEIRKQFKNTNNLIKSTSSKKQTISSEKATKERTAPEGKKRKFSSLEEYEKYQEEIEKAKEVEQYGGTTYGKKFVYGMRKGLLGDKYARKKAAKNADKDEREKALRLLYPNLFESSNTTPTLQSPEVSNSKPQSQTSEIEPTIQPAPTQPKINPVDEVQAPNISTEPEKPKKEKPKTVTRLDSSKIEDFSKDLKSYKHTDDWSVSGLDTGDNSWWEDQGITPKTSKGIFAGDSKFTALYASGNSTETKFVNYDDPDTNQPTVVFDLKDKDRITSHKAYLTVFDADDFEEKGTGEFFSENPKSPLEQKEITDPLAYIESQGWTVKWSDDLSEVAQELEKKNVKFGAEGLDINSEESNETSEVEPIPETPIPSMEKEVESDVTPEVTPPPLPPPLPPQQETPSFIKKLQEKADKLSQSKFVKGLEEKASKLAETPFVKNLQGKAQEISEKISETPFVKNLKNKAKELTSTSTPEVIAQPQPTPQILTQDQPTPEVTVEPPPPIDSQVVEPSPIVQEVPKVGSIDSQPSPQPPEQKIVERNKSNRLKTEVLKEKLKEKRNQKKKFASVEEYDKNQEEVEKAKEVMQYGGSTYGKKFVYGLRKGLLGDKYARKKAAKNADKDEREKAFKLLHPDLIEPISDEQKTIDQNQKSTEAAAPEVQPQPQSTETAAPEVQPTTQVTNPTSQTSEGNTNLDEVLKSTNQIPEIKDAVDRIEKRVSPRDIDVGKGDQAQTYRYDPLAPQGKQVTSVTESGKAGGFASKKDEASVLTKAAYLGNKDLEDKKQQEDDRKVESQARVQTPEIVPNVVSSPELGEVAPASASGNAADLTISTPIAEPLAEQETPELEVQAANAVAVEKQKAESEQENRQEVIDKLKVLDEKLDKIIKKQEEDSENGGLNFGKRGLGRAARGAARALGRAGRALGRGAASIGRAAGPALGRIATTAARFAGPAAAVAGAGYTGYKVGQAIDSGVEKLTGKSLSDRTASGVGALTGQNEEENAAVHAGEGPPGSEKAKINALLKGTGYEIVSPGKYKGPDGKVVSKDQLPPEIQNKIKPGSATEKPKAGTPEAKPDTQSTQATPTPTSTPVTSAAAPAAMAAGAAAVGAAASGSSEAAPQTEVTSTPQAAPIVAPVVSPPSSPSSQTTGVITSESKDKKQEQAITKLTSENEALKNEVKALRPRQKPKKPPPPPPPKPPKKEANKETTVIQIRNVEQSVATYTASIFDHPVVHPGIYKM